jgi:raffinose/stachyose/melibiose transport system permease protein
VIPVIVGLAAASLLREIRRSRFAHGARTVLFLPQVIPLAGAAVAWTWMYSRDGLINEMLRLVGLDRFARPWLGDFTTALPAVGLIGSWVASGFCTMMFLAGIGKIDVSLYEAARIDGAGFVREFCAVTLPGLRHEIVVAATVTVISALASFDIVYVSTRGGPGYSTMVPGVQVVRLAFTENKIGLASALAMVLVVIMLVVVLPLQRLARHEGRT